MGKTQSKIMITFNSLGFYGRLGNQMFQIAGTIGIAMDNYHEYGFPAWVNYDHKRSFGSAEDIQLGKYFKHTLPEVDRSVEYPDYPVQWGYHKVVCPNWVSISGHLQSERYFKQYEYLIRRQFTMKKLSTHKPKRHSTALHVRLGDYDGAYHTRLSVDYYGKAAHKLGVYNICMYSQMSQTKHGRCSVRVPRI